MICMEDTSKNEILEAIGLLAEHMQEMREDMTSMKVGLEKRMSGIESQMHGFDKQMSGLEMRVVTKSYLDDKLADLRADLVVLTRKANTKLSVFVEEMVAAGSLKRAAADQILAMEPFAQ
jgi:hypothetical protein